MRTDISIEEQWIGERFYDHSGNEREEAGKRL